ncbi:MAG TPA: TIGR00730 family Rossman fold protein [Patescibacteria group bacterium]|nr:TIGR00730 family Rossman fold protein [Patescibacteria group bacterium]
MNICFFCAASDLEPRYTEPAVRLARMVAEAGHTLVWGGSDRGLMSDIARAAQAAGGEVLGITMESLKQTALESADRMIVARDLAERKALMLEHSDAIVTLTGGTGTLDEFTELFELRRHGVHDKPLIILNTEGFYDGLLTQWQRMADDDFLDRLPRPLFELVTMAETPEEVMALVEGELAVPQKILSTPLVFSNEAI